MTRDHKVVVGYLAVVAAAFLVGYVFLGIRELGLYLFLTAINLPSSLVMVPLMEGASLAVGLVLGKPMHVWATQIACMTTNGVFLLALVAIVRKLRSTHSGDGSAV